MKLFKPAVLTALIALLFSANSLQAQTDMSKWKVGIFPAILQYHGSDGNEFFKLKQSTVAVDLGIGRRLNSSLDLEGHFMGGNLDWAATDSTGEDFSTSVFDLGARLVYKFANGYILKEDARIAPFVFAGVQGMKSEPGYGADFPLGGGLNFRFDDLFSMQLRSEFKPTTRSEFNMIQHSLGFVWTLGSKGDSHPADRDNDGIVDIDDRCPDEPGDASNDGCPEAADRDNDGIVDADDHCPDVAGIAANAGCPEIDDETKSVLAEALHGIHFQTGKDLLTDDSKPVLDHVVSLLNKHPEYNLSIAGHTDNTGDAAMNLDLSKRRAKRAMDYLISHGIDANRLQSEGYGETDPVADNSTAEGRAENRRVVLTILF